MDNWTVFLIITAVLGVIASNIMLLKYSAKFKFPNEFKTMQQREKESEEDKRSKDKQIEKAN